MNNIQVPNSSHISNTEEILRYLLDTHFPGNTPYGDNNSGANYQASDEDWQIATTIVTEERVRWAVAYFAPFKSPGIDGIYPVFLTADLAQNHPLWRMMSTYGATQSSVARQKQRRRR